MAKSNITTKKKNVTTQPPAEAATPQASRDGAKPAPPVGEIAAEVVTAAAAPLIAKAGKLKRIIKSKAKAAIAAIQPSTATPTAQLGTGNGTRAAVPKVTAPPTPVTEPVKTKRMGKPRTPAATPRLKATDTAPSPAPPILGVTKPTAKVKSPAKPKKVGFTAQDVALRAYFIAQRRQAEGRPGSPESDWLQAESELRAESYAPRPI